MQCILSKLDSDGVRKFIIPGGLLTIIPNQARVFDLDDRTDAGDLIKIVAYPYTIWEMEHILIKAANSYYTKGLPLDFQLQLRLRQFAHALYDFGENELQRAYEGGKNS